MCVCMCVYLFVVVIIVIASVVVVVVASLVLSYVKMTTIKSRSSSQRQPCCPNLLTLVFFFVDVECVFKNSTIISFDSREARPNTILLESKVKLKFQWFIGSRVYSECINSIRMRLISGCSIKCVLQRLKIN